MTNVQTILRSLSFRLALLAIFTAGLCAVAMAQGNAVTRVSTSVAPAEDTVYRIGAGDVIAILTRKAPELSVEAVRVDQRGMIRIPMVDGEVFAACQTENELASKIAKLYLEYKNNPNVEVFVRDFQSQPVAVIGAVMTPGQFRLQRRIRLLDLLGYAGGPSEKSGRVINIIHSGAPNLCEGGDASAAPAPQELKVVELNETLLGKDDANPFVRAGDIISVPPAEQVFVVGYVYQPATIPLKDKSITISRAIAMAGGPQRDSNTGKVRLIRQSSKGDKVEMIVDLKAIERRQQPDIVLIPNDVVDVPSSTGKRLLNALTGAIAPTLANTTVRVIP